MRGAELVERGGDGVEVGGPDGAAGRHARRVHDALREGLRSLEGGGRLAGAEDRDLLGAHGIRDPGDERRFRADDDQLDVVVDGVARHDASRSTGRAPTRLDDGGDAGVAGRRDDLVPRLLPQEGGDDRVFACSGPEHEDSHRHQGTCG